MRWERAFAGMSRTQSSPVDETAITLKLRPVSPRARMRWHIAVAATIAVTAGVVALVDAPAAASMERALSPSARALVRSRVDPDPIFAAAAHPVLEPAEDVVDEIVIFDEPVAEANTRAARRARARSSARAHASAGEAARSAGDLARARREYEAALVALPSYAPAAAALAEIHMTQGRYRPALGYARRALRWAPRKLDYMVLAGDVYARTSQRAAAQKLWRKAAAYGSVEAKSRLL